MRMPDKCRSSNNNKHNNNNSDNPLTSRRTDGGKKRSELKVFPHILLYLVSWIALKRASDREFERKLIFTLIFHFMYVEQEIMLCLFFSLFIEKAKYVHCTTEL